MHPEHQAYCADCDVVWAGSDDREMVELAAPEHCQRCGESLEFRYVTI